MAPVLHALRQYPERFQVSLCVTAQHRHMLDQVLELFYLNPDFDLDIMREGQDLFDVTCGVLVGVGDVVRRWAPDLVLVHGDTTTSMAAALAAFYCQVPVGHVEAGLRTQDLSAPYPEELNRQVTARVTRFHFAPTESAKRNLLAEGIANSQIYVTGNTVIDALLQVTAKLDSSRARQQKIRMDLSRQLPIKTIDGRFVLVTGHRRENFGAGIEQICRALAIIAQQEPGVSIVYPVHLNPNIRGPVRALLADIENVHLVEPIGYEAFVYLLKKCELVLTDSGGVQEEAPSLGKPVLVMRDITERPEALEAGTVCLVGLR
jgi:UDP-N-acetylglucosamine 2-epimerase (non-hydrolysing)